MADYTHMTIEDVTDAGPQFGAEGFAEIAKGDALRVAPEVIRSFASGPDGLEMLAFGARHQNDGEVFENWWPAG